MSKSHLTVDDSLPLSVVERVDAVCDRFEDVWRAGQRPRIEEYLADVADERLREALVKELVALDIYHRQQLGETILAQDYQHLTPLAADLLAAAAMPLAAPERYRLGEKIGVGGMGEVRRGRDLRLNRDLAIKVLRPEHQGHTYLQQRFLEEARIGGRLQHPGIVPVHDLGELSDGRPFFTMKLVEGRNLADLLDERTDSGQDWPRFLSIFEQICQTLAYAHAQGVIHRDLKPANVMVGAFGEVQVMDWGLAKVLNSGRVAEGAARCERVADGPILEDTAWEMRTRTGQAMGTLSYMPPEQARGEVGRVDKRSDVFGLGAILCEVLTGRPPFTGTGGNEIFAKAKACDHAAALARLDACGAEAELVALAKACLAAEPADRPANGGEVAEGMKAYLAGVQERLREAERERAAAQARAEESRKTAVAEQARAEEAQKKVAAERRARRRTVWLATAVLLLGFLGGGWGLWWTWQRAELVRLGNADLAEVKDNLEKWKMRDAQKAMERVEGRVAGGGPVDLLQRVQQMRDDLTLVKRLEDIRLKKATVGVKGKFDHARADRDYAALFAEGGLAMEGEDATVVAARIRNSAIKAQLVAALDEWAILTAKPTRWSWLLEVARRAEPGEWSDQFRDPAVWAKPAALERLAKEANVAELSPPLLVALGSRLYRTKANGVPLLTAAQERHPNDFWLNLNLGDALHKSKPEEAMGYYRAALAVQPESSVVYYNLGVILKDKGQLDKAIQAYQRAIELDPRLARAYYNLGLVLAAKGQPDEAIQEYRRAIELDPKDAKAHVNLGVSLADKGRLDEAIQEFQRAIQLDPKWAKAHYNLGNALADKGRLDDAIQEFQRAVELDPKDAKAYINLGIALKAKGRLDEAIQEFQRAIELDPKFALPHVNLGVALAVKGRLDEAIQAFQQAIDLDPKKAKVHFYLGNALADKGRLDEAIQEFQRAIELDPKDALAHGALGEALLLQGRFAKARETTRHCLELLPAKHPLRQPVAQKLQQCEQLLALDAKLPAILKSEAKPTDSAERIGFASMCRQYKHLYTASARFYTDAFADQPQLAEDLDEGHRYNAACAAALAGSGKGKDAGRLPDKEYARLRKQALDWLRADLTAWTKVIDKGPPQARQVVAQALQQWQKDPDLASLRDKDTVDKLPPAERDACRQLWNDAADLLQRTQRK